MCNQAVSLAAADMERRGIVTAVIQLLREPAERVGPPRALLLPFRHGYPLDQPKEPAKQRAVLEALLQLCEEPNLKPPVLREYKPSS